MARLELTVQEQSVRFHPHWRSLIDGSNWAVSGMSAFVTKVIESGLSAFRPKVQAAD